MATGRIVLSGAFRRPPCSGRRVWGILGLVLVLALGPTAVLLPLRPPATALAPERQS